MRTRKFAFEINWPLVDSRVNYLKKVVRYILGMYIALYLVDPKVLQTGTTLIVQI